MIIKKYTIREWLESLQLADAARVQARIFRIEQGNLGDFKSVGHQVYELRLTFGSGFRVYFGFDGKEMIILIMGGDKASQKQDVIRARQYWIEYNSGSRYDS
jgi:putative addiction module killer protein